MCPKNDPSNAKRHLYSQPQDGSRGKSLSWKFQYTLKRTENKQPHTWLYLHCCVLRAFVSKLLWFHHLLNWCNVLGSSSWSQQQEKNSEGLNMTAKKKKKKLWNSRDFFSSPFPHISPTLCFTYVQEQGCTIQILSPFRTDHSPHQLPQCKLWTAPSCTDLQELPWALASLPSCQWQLGMWCQASAPLPPEGFTPGKQILNLRFMFEVWGWEEF